MAALHIAIAHALYTASCNVIIVIYMQLTIKLAIA